MNPINLENQPTQSFHMKAGDRIRLDVGNGNYSDLRDFTVEEFRFCLGIFLDDYRRYVGEFTPLCELYGPGPDSKHNYLNGYGDYITNKVPLFMNIP
jgi:hypothetical protein